jgi:hypothetical protein
MTTPEIAAQLVALCSKGNFAEAIHAFYSPDIVSVEAAAMPGQGRESVGLPAILGKAAWWEENHEVHSIAVEGPLATAHHFCVRFTIDVTFKPTGRRHTMDELAIYQVKDGKIIREEFFYPF